MGEREPSYSLAIRLATDRAFIWSATLDVVDYDDAERNRRARVCETEA